MDKQGVRHVPEHRRALQPRPARRHQLAVLACKQGQGVSQGLWMNREYAMFLSTGAPSSRGPPAVTSPPYSPGNHSDHRDHHDHPVLTKHVGAPYRPAPASRREEELQRSSA